MTLTADASPSLGSTEQSADSPGLPRWPTVFHYVILTIVFLFGTALRFSDLSHPGIWKDEASTYWRVSGTYGQMLDILQYDGFMPLHYEMYFVLGRLTDLSPAMMRQIPATAGSLTILAVYFLARQMFARRVALIAATLAAFSAFFFYYSRDAKMYAALYLTCVASVACLLWWLRTRRTEAWLSWVAVSSAMLGLHALGAVVLGLQPLILLTHRRGLHWRPIGAFIVGTILIVSGLVVHARYFNQLKEKIDQEGWQASGLAWIDYEIAGDSGEDLLEFVLVQDAFTGSRKEMRVSDPVITPWQRIMRWSFIATVIGGMYPWPSKRRKDMPAIAPWRRMFWLAISIVIPVYAFYCISVTDYAWPSEAAGSALRLWGWPWGVLGLIGAVGGFIACDTTIIGRLKKTGALVGVIVATFLLCLAIAVGCRDRSFEPLWMARYFGYIVAPLFIVAAALLHRLPGPLAWAGVALFIATNLPTFPSTFLRPAPTSVLQVFAQDIAADQADDGPTRTYTLPPSSQGLARMLEFEAIESRYYLFWATGRKTYPQEFRYGAVADLFRIRPVVSRQRIARDVAKDLNIRRVIVWEDDRLAPGDNPREIELPGFRTTDTNTYVARQIVDRLMNGYTIIRHELVRTDPN